MGRRKVAFGRLQFRQKRLCARGLVCAAMRRFAFGRAGGNIGSAFSSLWKMASTRAFPIRRVSRFVRGMFRALCGDACASRAETRFCWEDTPVMWFYRGVLRSITPVMRFYRGVLHSITPAVCHIAPKQDGLRDVSFLFRRGSGSPIVRSLLSCGYPALWVHFGTVRFLMAIPTGVRPRSAYTKRSAALGGRFSRYDLLSR